MDALFLKILDMSKIASIVILFVLAARLFLKKAPKIYSYLLWAAVLFRLLCPVSFEAPLSVLPNMETMEDTYTLAEKNISFAEAGVAAYQAVGDALKGGLGMQYIPTNETDDNGNVVYVTLTWWEVWILFGKYLWLMGIAGMVGYSIISFYKLKKKLVGTVLLQDNIYISDYIDSPFVMGLVRPKIYLPSSLNEKEQEYVILHEQQHIKRKDHWIKVLAFFALCIHWFNPLVWAAFILANKDMEMSCDEAVVNKMGVEIRADYSASLLSLATGRQLILGAPLAFGEGDTKGRITNMAKWKKPALWICIVSAVIVASIGIVLLINPKEMENENKIVFLNYIPDTSHESVSIGRNALYWRYELSDDDDTLYAVFLDYSNSISEEAREGDPVWDDSKSYEENVLASYDYWTQVTVELMKDTGLIVLEDYPFCHYNQEDLILYYGYEDRMGLGLCAVAGTYQQLCEVFDGTEAFDGHLFRVWCAPRPDILEKMIAVGWKGTIEDEWPLYWLYDNHELLELMIGNNQQVAMEIPYEELSEEESLKKEGIFGQVISCGKNPQFIEVRDEGGKNYGFIITKDTELVWKNVSAYELSKDIKTEWEIFSAIFGDLKVHVTAGKEVKNVKVDTGNKVEGWYYADNMTAIGE